MLSSPRISSAHKVPLRIFLILYFLTVIITFCSHLRLAQKSEIHCFYCYDYRFLSLNVALFQDYEQPFHCSLIFNEDITAKKRILGLQFWKPAIQGKTVLTLRVTQYPFLQNIDLNWYLHSIFFNHDCTPKACLHGHPRQLSLWVFLCYTFWFWDFLPKD